MPPSEPRVDIRGTADSVRVVLHGRWTADALAQPQRCQQMHDRLRSAPKRSHWDLQEIERMDHTGAQLLWNGWGRRWPQEVALSRALRDMLTRVERYSRAPPAMRRITFHSAMDRLGARVLQVLTHGVDALRLLGQLGLDLLQLLRAPARGPWRDISGHLYRIGATALPITALVGFLIGIVLAYLMSRQLVQFGADIFIVNILGVALTRELGPVLAAILIAGRSGSAITAQIGVMRVTEELDAMRVMGIPKGYRLVMPRVLAMALAMPLLSVWTIVAGLFGGMMVADFSMGLTPAYFMSALGKSVNVANLWLAVSKSAVFGILIALIACHYGLHIKPNTTSLGEGTTASVVTSITMVIAVNAVFAILFRGVGV